MRKLLMKSIPVNVRKNLGTYILLTILVMTGMYIASAMAGITYSYDTANEEKTGISNSEDGLFQVFDFGVYQSLSLKEKLRKDV